MTRRRQTASRATSRLHRASVIGRARADLGLLVLMGVVVAIVTLLMSSVAPLTARTSDRAIAGAVGDAGSRAAVIATSREQAGDDAGVRDPNSAVLLKKNGADARAEMSDRLAAAVRPGVTSLTTPPLHLLDAGPGRFLRLAYVTRPGPALATTYISGGPPKPGLSARTEEAIPGDIDPWPIQVALPQAAAEALDVRTGDQLPAEDEQHRKMEIVVSGVFIAENAKDDAWSAVPDLLHPIIGKSDGLTSTSAGALVTDESLPDLRIGVPADDLTNRIIFTPRPSMMRAAEAEELTKAVVSMKTSVRTSRGRTWDSLLDTVLIDASAQVSAARGQASVLLIGLLAGSFMVLVLAAQLLVRRRSGAIALVRERGASLVGIFVELVVEAVVVAIIGTSVGMLIALGLAGGVGWMWSIPVVLAATFAGPVLGIATAARAADNRRVPANRTARRAAARGRQVRRLMLEGVAVAIAALSYVALAQRGVVDDSDLTASSAPIWWAVTGGLLLARALPVAARLMLKRSRRSRGAVPLVAAAQASVTVARALPLLVVVVTIAQLTFGLSLATTEEDGQVQGALQSVGGDARLQTAPDRSVTAMAASVSQAPGVEGAVAARIEDGLVMSSGPTSAVVRLVVVDSAAYERLLNLTDLPSAPKLSRLDSHLDGRVPALLCGGDVALRDAPQLRWEDMLVPLTVVGSAPQVGDSTSPVLIVDATAFAEAGPIVDPGTIWAVGPGAANALRASGSDGSVDVLTDVIDERRSAPLASALVSLALVSSLLLALLAILGVALAIASEAPTRALSLGRLRSLGFEWRDLQRILLRELIPPVLLSALAGFALGVITALAMFDSLSLKLVTGQISEPGVVVPWWTALTVVALVATVIVIARSEASRIARIPLATLLRGGGSV